MSENNDYEVEHNNILPTQTSDSEFRAQALGVLSVLTIGIGVYMLGYAVPELLEAVDNGSELEIASNGLQTLIGTTGIAVGIYSAKLAFNHWREQLANASRRSEEQQ